MNLFPTKEKWLPIYKGLYQVSDRGRVRRVNGNHGSTLKRYKEKSGYLTVRPCVNGKATTKLVHRLVAEAFLGRCPRGYQVNHKDGNKCNNTPKNLEYLTPKQNIAHGIKTGLIPHFGEDNGFSVLTADDLFTISKLRKEGKTLKEIGKELKVHHTTISHILRGKMWKGLLPE